MAEGGLHFPGFKSQYASSLKADVPAFTTTEVVTVSRLALQCMVRYKQL